MWPFITRTYGALQHYERALRRRAVRTIASYRFSRKLLNSYYRTLSLVGRERFYQSYAKIFDADRSCRGGIWSVDFAGRTLLIEVRPDRAWLDWDLAVSIIGRDMEVKQTYVTVLSSPNRPELFVDIGANYGTHSLMFLAHGIPTVTFEPNAECCKEIGALCRLNGFEPRVEAVGLGECTGITTLRYPKHATWLGSTTLEWKLEDSADIVVQECEIRTLDSYGLTGRMLIKIDAEGYELPILRGAASTLATQRPMVIFESLRGTDRHSLFSFLENHDYAILSLPLASSSAIFTLDSFSKSEQTNFVALPRRIADAEIVHQ